jgi:membrane peptidoglycan carboxypeptidase
VSDKSRGSADPPPEEPNNPPDGAGNADDNLDSKDNGKDDALVIIRADHSPAAMADADADAAANPEAAAADAGKPAEPGREETLTRGTAAVPTKPAPKPAPEPVKKPTRKPASKAAPKAATAKPRKRRSRLARYTRLAGFALLGLIACAVLGFAIVYMMTPVPSSAKADAMAKGSTFYFSDGKSSFYQEGMDRRPVPLDKVPQSVRMAVIAAENRSFYADPGVSVSGTARALWSTVSGAQVQGGSTITQQMVRNYYSGVSQDRTVTRKLKEIMVALKVGNEKNKDWILEQYLNTIYFGRGAYGIQAAAHAYFDTDVGRLTESEAAYLAAAIQTPSGFAEPVNRGYAEARWHYVVDGMVKLGAVPPADAAAMEFPEPEKERETPTLRGQTGYMWKIARQEAISRGYTEDQILRGGLKIVTTFDKRLMDAAEHAVTSQLPKGTSKKVQTGLVAVNPANGEVEAFYGGRDYLKEQFDSATDAEVQAGSGFKPYVLAAALADGEDLGMTVDGRSPQYFNGPRRCASGTAGCTKVENNGGVSYGMVNLVTATQRSVNTAYVNLGLEVGLGKVKDMAEKAGIPEKQLAPNADAPTLSLGVTAVSPLQQAAGYATFAAEGVHRAPHVIKSINESDGDVRRITATGTRAFSASVARDATYAMTRVVRSGTGTNARLPDNRPVAGKTGTTDEGKAIWFNGFVPQLATSVAMFRNDNKPLRIPGYSVYGGVLPAQIWRVFMADAAKDLPVKQFGPPTNWTPDSAADRAPARPEPTRSGSEPEPSVPVEPSVKPVEPTPQPSPTEEPPDPTPTRSGILPTRTRDAVV